MAAQATEFKATKKCSSAPSRDQIVILNSSTKTNTLTGWSHADPSIEEFQSMQFGVNVYQTEEMTLRPSKNCKDLWTIKTVLAVKLSDWTRQHINGVEARFEDLRVEDIAALNLRVLLNKPESRLFSREALIKTYPNLGEDLITQLGDRQASLQITLFADGALDQSSRSLNLSKLIVIDERAFELGWFDVQIPVKAFDAYYEQNYQKELVDLRAARNDTLTGFRLTLETASGKQLRNLMGDAWSDSAPETINELSIELSDIVIELSDIGIRLKEES